MLTLFSCLSVLPDAVVAATRYAFAMLTLLYRRAAPPRAMPPPCRHALLPDATPRRYLLLTRRYFFCRYAIRCPPRYYRHHAMTDIVMFA